MKKEAASEVDRERINFGLVEMREEAENTV